MTKLHEVLAVEPDLEGVAKKVTAEATKTFDKAAMFFGFEKIWEMFDEAQADQAPAPEHQALTTTVGQKLSYVCKHLGRYWDGVLTKEKANQEAKADLVVDGEILLTGAPATFLLGLENKLRGLRAMYEAIPTLSTGTTWEPAPDIGEGVYRAFHPEQRFKTAKTFQHKVLVPAQFPKEGEGGSSQPAIVERWEETVNVGRSTKTVWSGMISAARKAEILGRLDRVIQETKRARQRANGVEVQKTSFAKKLFEYING